MERKHETKKAVMAALADGEWHSVTEIAGRCEAYGRKFEKGRTALYDMLNKLKKSGTVETKERGVYRLCKNKNSGEIIEKRVIVEDNNGVIDEKLRMALDVINEYLDQYTSLWWYKCTEKDLKDGRAAMDALVEMSKKIQKISEKQ